MNNADRKIIAFYSPYPRAGKTTAAEYISNNLTEEFDLRSFATPIKTFVDDIVWNLNGQDELKDTPLESFGGATTRDLLKAFGNAGRSVYPDIWVDMLKDGMNIFPDDNFVIDDLRFPNEYAMLKDIGAKIVRITNPEREIVKTETEGLLEGFDFDYELINYKRSIVEYRAQIRQMIYELWT